MNYFETLFHYSTEPSVEMPTIHDVIVIGGGAIGLATTYELAKSGKRVMLLERNNLYNQSGSSADMARMFRTM